MYKNEIEIAVPSKNTYSIHFFPDGTRREIEKMLLKCALKH